MSSGTEARQLAKTLRQQGYTVTLAHSGHYNVEKDGRFLTSFSCTPGTRRFKEHVKMALRRREREIHAEAI